MKPWHGLEDLTVSSSFEFLFPALNCDVEAQCLMKKHYLEQSCGLQSLIYPGGSEGHRRGASEHSHFQLGTKGHGYFQSVGLRSASQPKSTGSSRSLGQIKPNLLPYAAPHFHRAGDLSHKQVMLLPYAVPHFPSASKPQSQPPRGKLPAAIPAKVKARVRRCLPESLNSKWNLQPTHSGASDHQSEPPLLVSTTCLCCPKMQRDTYCATVRDGGTAPCSVTATVCSHWVLCLSIEALSPSLLNTNPSLCLNIPQAGPKLEMTTQRSPSTAL